MKTDEFSRVEALAAGDEAAQRVPRTLEFALAHLAIKLTHERDTREMNVGNDCLCRVVSVDCQWFPKKRFNHFGHYIKIRYINST